MAKILVKSNNGVFNVRYLKKPNRYFIFKGNSRAYLQNYAGHAGFIKIQDAVDYMNKVN